MEHSRRAFLGGLTALAVSGFAGCTGGNRVTPSGTPHQTVATDADFDGYLSTATNYDRSVADARGREEPTILVGAAGNGGNRAYEPPALAVDPGTTVVWEWTGAGGAHNVVSESGAFGSELVTESGHTFERRFDDAGVYKYHCTPHLRNGMKGVVAVGDVL